MSGHRCNSYKYVTDAGLADLLRRNVLDLAEMLKEARKRKISVLILARSYEQQIQQYYYTHHVHEFTQHDSPVVASVTRTKSETF